MGLAILPFFPLKSSPAYLKGFIMRTKPLTDEEIREIESWKCKRHKYNITVPIIAQWNGYNKFHLYAVETHKYPFTDRLRRAYTKVIKVFAKRVKPNVRYEKRETK